MPQHPNLSADDLRVGQQVRDLDHVAPSAGPEYEVVVGFAREAVELAGQPKLLLTAPAASAVVTGTDGVSRITSELRSPEPSRT